MDRRRRHRLVPLRARRHGLRRLGFVLQGESRPDRHEVGLRARDALHRRHWCGALRPLVEGAATGNARGIREAALEAGAWIDDPLRGRRRYRDHPRGHDHGAHRLPDVGRSHRGVRLRVRVRPLHLPGALHEEHHWRVLPPRAQDVADPGVALDEHGHGRDAPRDGRADDGRRHACDGSAGVRLLGRDVLERHRWFRRCLSGERLARQCRPEARHGHAAKERDPGEEVRRRHVRARDGRTRVALVAHVIPHGAKKDPAFEVTRPQIAAMSALTILALVVASVYSAGRANLTISSHDIAGAVMPPGMPARRDLSAASMRDMAAANVRAVRYEAPVDARGDQPLEPRVEGGVKVFELEASVIGWSILPRVRVTAYAFNGQVPGPRIRVTEGDRVRLIVRNSLPEPTSVHWHGLVVPNAMDGVASITQAPIPPGGSYTYEFEARQAGTYFYHSHLEPDRQQGLGMYGALIVDPRSTPTARAGPTAYDKELVVELQEWLVKDGYTFPAMPMDSMQPNYFTINGKAYPATETVRLKVGERLLVRFIGSGSGFIHPMHIHGGPFTIVATDGNVVPESARIQKDTVNVGPGERYDVIWMAREPGKWLLHCHINHHTTNDNHEDEGAGGLTLIINVSAQ